eukprot:8100109-Alexandrium_andersonii.AAC.1
MIGWCVLVLSALACSAHASGAPSTRARAQTTRVSGCAPRMGMLTALREQSASALACQLRAGLCVLCVRACSLTGVLGTHCA